MSAAAGDQKARSALPRSIGAIGGGQMAEALLRGLLEAGHPADGLAVAEPRAERRADLTARLGVRTTADNAELAASAELVVLAMKPAQLEGAVRGLSTRPLYVSILAGRTLRDLQASLGAGARVLRAMPNTAALVGASASALAAPTETAEADLALGEALLATVGDVVRVPEYWLDAVTGLSGSGPAYVYTFLEALADGAVHEGLDYATARRLAAQTLLGAARMAIESGEHPALLRERVTSPGGTTIAGLCALEAGGMRAAVTSAVRAATERSRALGRR